MLSNATVEMSTAMSTASEELSDVGGKRKHMTGEDARIAESASSSKRLKGTDGPDGRTPESEKLSDVGGKRKHMTGEDALIADSASSSKRLKGTAGPDARTPEKTLCTVLIRKHLRTLNSTEDEMRGETWTQWWLQNTNTHFDAAKCPSRAVSCTATAYSGGGSDSDASSVWTCMSDEFCGCGDVHDGMEIGPIRMLDLGEGDCRPMTPFMLAYMHRHGNCAHKAPGAAKIRAAERKETQHTTD
jgi:hypothetical protein